jgi:hypothetical protein
MIAPVGRVSRKVSREKVPLYAVFILGDDYSNYFRNFSREQFESRRAPDARFGKKEWIRRIFFWLRRKFDV